MKQHFLAILFAICLLSSLIEPISAQKVMTFHHGCNYDGAESEVEYYVDESSNEAIQIVEKIMRVIVLPQNFIVKSANCKNALATAEGASRYILYSTHFLENFKKEANTQWAAYSVLAHEIGHHLSNHNLAETNTQKRKIQELQADKFAGGVLYRLGATLEQAQAGIKTFSLEGETTTHPSKTARLESVAQGWVQAKEMQPINEEKTTEIPHIKPKQQTGDVKFTEVSDNIAFGKIIGKWQSENAFKEIYEFPKKGVAKLTQYFAVSKTTQETNFRWEIIDGDFVRYKVFPNGSLGSPQKFKLTFSEDGKIMRIYDNFGVVGVWNRMQ
jgi:hypothetical protein